MKWFKMAYTDNYGKDHAHTFSGNVGTVRMVMEAYKIDLDMVTFFTIDDVPVDLAHYLGGDE